MIDLESLREQLAQASAARDEVRRAMERTMEKIREQRATVAGISDPVERARGEDLIAQAEINHTATLNLLSAEDQLGLLGVSLTALWERVLALEKRVS